MCEKSELSSLTPVPKSSQCTPNIFAAFNNSVDHLWMYINIFEFKCVSSFPTSGEQVPYVYSQLSCSLVCFLKSLKFQRMFLVFWDLMNELQPTYLNLSWLYRFQLYLTRSLFSHLPNPKSHNIFETPFRNIRCCLCDAKHLAENGIKQRNIRIYSHIQLFGIR